MPYVKLHPVKQLDFQINRILTYGGKACDFGEVKAAAAEISDLRSWHVVWKRLGEKAAGENRSLHAAYYFRLAEFFQKDSPEKNETTAQSLANFHKVIRADVSVRFAYAPYKDTVMKTLVFTCDNPKGSLVIFGGYDSFIEEFYLAVKEFSAFGFTVYLFEGPGQGETLKRGLVFEPHWENPVKAVLDYFHLENAYAVGISWGGYLALRAAAFEKRITKAVAYDVLYDGFDCMLNPFPAPARALLRFLFKRGARTAINAIINRAMGKSLILDWAVSHGQYITGTKSPYDFYTHLQAHTLRGIAGKIDCDVLLLAGESDHYIPRTHFTALMREITNAASLTGRMFTQAEGGAEHCQIGNHGLAVDCILSWLSGLERTRH